jgi:serine/threonine protein kinase
MAAAAVSTEACQTVGKRPEPPTLERLTAAFPQLEVIQLIGQGGMGAVYKARQKQLDRIVALKVLPPGIGGDPAFAERFTREAKALAKLLHPNIVALFEFGQADGIYYLLMEYVDGVSLGQLLRASRVSAREALAIVPQICDALQYAHDQGIVHRDIKPENILLDRRGRVKVADFGLAKLVEPNTPLTPSRNHWQMADGKGERAPLTGTGKILGTPNYMAPEQIEHPGEVDHRADIYGLGVVFYQMLTGELPGKHMEPPSKKVQIDVRLDEVVMHALEKNPELRYQQVSEVKTMVETIVATKSAPIHYSPIRVASTLYKDGLIDITDQEVIFHRYYFPFGGDKRVPLNHIERIEARPPSFFGGSWRIWGSGDFQTWFPLDGARPSRDTIFIAFLHGRFRRIGFTVEDSKKVTEVLKERGLLHD